MTFRKTLPISIIIPTLNDAGPLEGLLSSLRQYQDLEIIICDGGSVDQSLETARKFGTKTVVSPAGRGIQQNKGAQIASHPTLLFLHCDTRPPDDFPGIIHSVLSKPGIAAGAFRLNIDAEGFAFRLVEWGANIRSTFLGLPYGDQAIFMRKQIFEKAGGFPDHPLLEDVALIRRLRRQGRVIIAPASVSTSGRRWQRHGVVRITLLNQFILLAYLAGVSPERLRRLYYKSTAENEAKNKTF